MIKKLCDRCGKEIVGEPWHMRWYQNTMSGLGMAGAMLYSNLCSLADAANSYQDAVRQAEVPMYCDECRAEILAFAAKKPESEEVVVEVSDVEAIEALELVDRYCSGKDCKKCVFSEESGECAIFDDGYTLDEIARFARDKFWKAHGGKK